MIFLFCENEMLIYNGKIASFMYILVYYMYSFLLFNYFWYTCTSDCFDEYNLNLWNRNIFCKCRWWYLWNWFWFEWATCTLCFQEPLSNGPLFCELHFYQRVSKPEMSKNFYSCTSLKLHWKFFKGYGKD